MQNTGTILLVLGFLSLVFSRLIVDPAATDANIGSGMLIIVGFTLGGVGMLLLGAATIKRMVARNQNS
ncbi:hypothetical protein [Humidisolicoccus flavus]|uniref:hypothetical protein n=1 Tax=Humidisolicoccus flavus TaxID=3111414 RepID=UPI003245D70A